MVRMRSRVDSQGEMVRMRSRVDSQVEIGKMDSLGEREMGRMKMDGLRLGEEYRRDLRSGGIGQMDEILKMIKQKEEEIAALKMELIKMRQAMEEENLGMMLEIASEARHHSYPCGWWQKAHMAPAVHANNLKILYSKLNKHIPA